MQNKNLRKKSVLELKKQKIVNLSSTAKATNYCVGGTDGTKATTCATTDIDAMYVAYITM